MSISRADKLIIYDASDPTKRLKFDLSTMDPGQVRTVTISADETAALTEHVHNASDITSGTVATARLGSGTADATTFLRGDQTWAAPGGGPGGGDEHGQATVDFSDGAESASVTVADAGVTTASRILGIMAYAPTGSRDLDELEMDSFEVKAGNIVNGVSFDVLVTCLTGYAHGTFYVNYERS